LILCLATGLTLAGEASADDRVSLLVGDSEALTAHRAIDGADFGTGTEARVFCIAELEGNPGDADFVKGSRVIVVDAMSSRLTRWILDNGAVGDGRAVFAYRSGRENEALKEAGFAFDTQVSDYYRNPTPDNIANMARRAISLTFDPDMPYGPIQEHPEMGVYHPAAPGVFQTADEYMEWYRTQPSYVEGRPLLGIMFYPTYLLEGQREPLDELIVMMEEEGFNVFPALGSDRALADGMMLDADRRSRVDAALCFSLRFAMSGERARRALIDMDVPAFNAVRLNGQTTEEWRGSVRGVTPLTVLMSIDNPETSGLIEPLVLMGKKTETLPDGSTAWRYELLPDHVRHAAGRIRRRIALKTKPAREKRVALMYWNNSSGKQGIGASYLNVFRSMSAIAERLAAEGYGVQLDPPLTEEEVKALVLRGGRNIGSWAPGELDALLDEGGAVQWPVSEYLEHFRKLPQEFRDKVTAQWGPPEEASIMARDGKLVIPVILRGNLALLPQGSRGMSDDPMKLYHDPHVYPHHQYIAVYLWLEHVWQADAVIHLGTHGTLEWLPGKQTGLALTDPPEVMLGTLPVVYPFIMDDPGEGIQAKRRGRAVMIDHLIPPLVTAGGYEEYVRLAGIIGDHEAAARMSSPTAEGYLDEIAELAAGLGLGKDLGIGDFRTPEAVLSISVYLESLASEDVPYGLHTFGTSPSGEAGESLLEVVVGMNPSLDRADTEAKIAASGPNELDSLAKALRGGYVEPGEANDPARNPAALPTGRNFYGISPGRIPTAEAWRLGQTAADEIIRNYMEAHGGAFPDKVAVYLWALEALRSEGLNESTVLALIGVEPAWDPSGVVSGTRPVPGSVLGRPRVDVAIETTSLYRDLFPDKILFLDRAIRQAAVQDDVENFIALGDDRNRRELRAKGFSEEEAGRFSRARIFSARPGAYGNRVAGAALASGLWEDSEDISRTFRENTGFAYGEDMWGEPARDSLELNLSGAKVAWHSMTSHLYGVLDNEDNFMSLGGLAMAVASLSEQAPDTFIADQRTPGQVHMVPIANVIGRETRARYLNPTWIEGMKGEGYAGAREMSDFVEFLWGWQVTVPDAVAGTLWDQAFEVYVEDKYGQDLPEFMDGNNPWAFQSITGRMLETVRKGYWAPSEETRRKLAVDYAMSVIERGVACCDHTCNNPQLHQMIMNIVSVPGVMSPELAARFRMAVEAAGKKPLEEQAAERERLLRDLGETRSSDDMNPPREAGPTDDRSDAESVRGLRMESVDRPAEESSLSSSGVEWTVSAFVLALLAVFFVGYRMMSRKRRRLPAGGGPEANGGQDGNDAI
jgi:cobaltochelatase CobN